MKTLTLMRHAKSSWDDFSISDFDRSLNARGESNAPLMGEVLKQKSFKPDLLLSSPANRAKTTAKIIADIIGYGKNNIIYVDSIYESSEMNIMMIVNAIDEQVNSCMLVGHNPAFTGVINALSSFKLDNLPTAGIVTFTFEGSWADIKPMSGEMLFYEYPKKHQG